MFPRWSLVVDGRGTASFHPFLEEPPQYREAAGCRGARPSVLFFSQPGLAASPHTVPSQGPWDNIGWGGGGASGALIGTNPDVVQGGPAAVLIRFNDTFPQVQTLDTVVVTMETTQSTESCY